MFTRLAKFRLVQPWRIAPGPREAMFSKDMFSRVMHSNDNLPGSRRPAATGKCRSPSPALACHWFDRNGRLECRWLAGTHTDAPPDDIDRRPARGQPRRPPRRRSLTLAG